MVALAAVVIRISWFGLIPFSVYYVLRKYLQNQNRTRALIGSGVLCVLFSSCCMAVLLFYFEIGYVYSDQENVVDLWEDMLPPQ